MALIAMNIRRILGDPLPKPEEKKFNAAFSILTLTAIIVIFLSFYLRIGEFCYYSVVSSAMLPVFYRGRKRMHLSWWLVVLATIFVIFNFAGGSIYVGGIRLYNAAFFGIPYDKFMHFAGFGILAFAMNSFFSKHLKSVKKHYSFIINVAVTMGVAAFLEVLEYIAVLTIGDVGVGDYFNNAQDLAAGFIGAIIGTFLARRTLKLRKSAVSA